MKNSMLKALLLTLLFLFTAQFVYGNGFEGPPAGFKLAGPAIIGTLSLTTTDAPLVVEAAFSGNCKGDPVSFEGLFQTAHPLAELTEQNLENFPLQDGAGGFPLACRAHDETSDDLIINTVTKFTNNGQIILADIVLLFLVPEKVK